MEGNLDLTLYSPNRRTILGRGNGLQDAETITHTATATGAYPVRVYGEGGTANGYALELDFEP